MTVVCGISHNNTIHIYIYNSDYYRNFANNKIHPLHTVDNLYYPFIVLKDKGTIMNVRSFAANVSVCSK
jgi:hypothetical protein